jgi:hypothetical protein
MFELQLLQVDIAAGQAKIERGLGALTRRVACRLPVVGRR